MPNTSTAELTGTVDDISEVESTSPRHKEQRSWSFHRHTTHPPPTDMDSRDLQTTQHTHSAISGLSFMHTSDFS